MPIVQYVDSVGAMSETRRQQTQQSNTERLNTTMRGRSVSVLYAAGQATTPTHFDIADPPYSGPLIDSSQRSFSIDARKRLFWPGRSPSFSATNLIVQGTPFTVSNTGAIPPDATAAIGDTQILFAVNSASGSYVSVTDKDTVLVGSFMMNSIAAPDTNCSAPTLGNPQVMWDNQQKVWLMMESGINGSNVLCVYVSISSDPLGSYHAFEYDFGSYYPDYAKLGLWRNVYGITLNLAPLTTGDEPKSLCVLDRSAVIAFIAEPTGPLPSIVCGAPFNGRLAGFASLNAWTPVTAEGGPMPPQATEAAGTATIGAVFFRHIDDELHSNATTALIDALEVEHWFNINFTAHTYNSIRYKLTVRDFDSRSGTCASPFACIPTPTAQKLDPLMEVLMQKASYRYIPATGQESLVLTLTSHANGVNVTRVYWFELRWISPFTNTQPLWVVHQQGVLPFNDTVHKFMGSIAMDGNGTIVIGYAASSDSVYPSMYAASRLANDPLDQMREPLLLFSGDVGSFLSSNLWGSYFCMSADPVESRNFYFSGQISSNTHPWSAKLAKVRIMGETIERTWLANDYCNGAASCVQIITTV